MKDYSSVFFEVGCNILFRLPLYWYVFIGQILPTIKTQHNSKELRIHGLSPSGAFLLNTGKEGIPNQRSIQKKASEACFFRFPLSVCADPLLIFL